MTEITYSDAVITFLDILGFRELVTNRSAAEISQAIDNLRSHASARAPADSERDISQAFAVNFSDCVVRIRYLDDESGIGALFHEVLALVHAQADLANRGIFVRGGISVGQVYMNAGNIFGPGFVQSYELENSFANFPRIIAGPEVFRLLREDRRLRADHHDVEDEVHYLRKIMRRGDDGLWFVDYLKGIKDEMDEPEHYEDFLLRHKNYVVSGAQKATNSLRVLQKYLWLASYHNMVCLEMTREEKVLITTGDIPSLETMQDISPHIRD